jgi:hypothetical protein
MKTEKLNVEAFLISGLEEQGLDPVTVTLQDVVPGKSGVIMVECYGDAWSAYFGAMSSPNIRAFVKSAGVDYLANKLRGPLQKDTKRNQKYRERIVTAIKAVL